jgi:hypothetical protein
MSNRGNLLVFATPIGERGRDSSALGEQMRDSESNMRKSSKPAKSAETPHIDFSGGVRGTYAKRYAAGTNLVALSPDVAEIFPDSTSVNEALRTFVRLSGKTLRVSRPARPKRIG